MSEFKQPKKNPLPTEKTKDLGNSEVGAVKKLADKPLHDAHTVLPGKGLRQKG